MHARGLVWAAMLCVVAAIFIKLPPLVARQDAIVHTYGPLVEVDALAKQRFVEEIRSDRLVDGAIRGMLQALDPYSGYIAPDEMARFKRSTAGEYIGIGVALGLRDDRVTVIAPVEGSPAAEANVQAGDVILAVDDVDVKGRTIFDVEELLQGLPDTKVRLTVRRADADAPLHLTIPRARVTLHAVRGCRRISEGAWDYLLDPRRRIGYIRVSNFNEHTLGEFDAALETLTRQGVAALILDLRFNPGGLMLEGVGMVDRFVDRGVILSTVTRRKAVQQFHATSTGTNTALELAVLINEASASSAEIVAGALQDYGRAVVVGTQSFGKGSVQHLIPLVDHPAAIKLTVAHYRLPGGRVIHRSRGNLAGQSWGIRPDVPVPLTRRQRRAVQQSRAALDVQHRRTPPDVYADGTCAELQRLEPLDGMIVPDCQLVAAHTVLLERLRATGAPEP